MCVYFRTTNEELMLSALVPFQITRCSKTLLAHITFVRFLVRVNTHVNFQLRRCTKMLLANFTFVRFLVRVNTHVDFQITRLTKSLLAHIAFVRFLVRVRSHVDFQIIRSTKALLAHITFVRSLVRVNTHMYGQIGLTSKHLLANIALVLLRPLSLPSLTRARFFSYLILLVFLLHHLRRQGIVVSRVKFSFLMTREYSPKVSPKRCETTTKTTL